MWIDSSMEFEEITSDDDRVLDVEECFESSASQFSGSCYGTTAVASRPSEYCFDQSEDVIHSSSDPSMEISTVREEGLSGVDKLFASSFVFTYAY